MVAFALCGCVGEREISVRYGEIHRHLVELRDHGHVEVEARATGGGGGNNATAVPDESTTVDLHWSAAIADLAVGCPDIPPFRGTKLGHPCALVDRRDDQWLVERRADRIRPHHVVAVVAGVVTLGSVGGAIYCGFECEHARGGKVIGLGITAAVSALVWLVTTGARD